MIDDNSKKILMSVAKKHKLKLLILFGSRAKGQNRKNSDWDFAILGNKKLSLNKKLKIYQDLDCITKFENVDLIDLNVVDEHILRQNIFKKGICIYENEKGLYDEEFVNTIYNYIDYSPLYKIEEEIVQKKLENL